MKKYLLIGTFDLLHSGHINLMYNASKLGEVYVIVTSDRVNNENETKGKMFINENLRKEMIESLLFVKEVFIYDPINGKDIGDYINEKNIDGIVYGTDYINDQSKKDMAAKFGVELVFFDRTEAVSSTQLREEIEKNIK